MQAIMYQRERPATSLTVAGIGRGASFFATLLLLGSVGCSGSKSDASVAVATSGPFDGPCEDLPAIPRRLWLLSNQQYSNAVRDVLQVDTGPTNVTGGS